MKIIVRDNLFVLETAHTHYVLGVDSAGIHRHVHFLFLLNFSVIVLLL